MKIMAENKEYVALMSSITSRHLGVLWLAVTMLLPRLAAAERLFVRTDGLPADAPGIERVQQLALDTDALATLRVETQAILTEFPLGVDGTATLTVDRFEPFAAGARAVVMEAAGPRDLALPDQLYYRGRVAGDAGSIVVLVAGADTARGFVSTAGTIYRFGRDRQGVHRSWALADVDPGAFPAPGAFCGNDEEVALVTGHGGRIGSLADPDAPAGAFSPTLLAEVAIETDQEFLARFTSSTEALTYLADLAAAASAIYDADTNVRVRFNFIRLWSITDPWAAMGTGGMLTEVRDYWQANEAATPRDTVHFISGKGVAGGLAYLDVLCDPNFGFGVSTVYGSFDMMNPSTLWDVVVVTHELGHNFGSPHTHCYDPPLDHCYRYEAGCYSGPISLPVGGGTIMSYCHLLGGIGSLNMTFGATVSAVLRSGSENGVCISVDDGVPTTSSTTTSSTTTTSITTTTISSDRPCRRNSDCPSKKCRHRKGGRVCVPLSSRDRSMR